MALLTAGTITFLELLKLLYPLANAQDLATFKSWCYPDKPTAKIVFVLSAEQHGELKEMFRIIDKDRSGELTVEELMTMFSASSITGDTGGKEAGPKGFFPQANRPAPTPLPPPPPTPPTPALPLTPPALK